MINSTVELIQALADNNLKEHTQSNVELKSSWKQDHGKQLSARANNLAHPLSWLVVGVDDGGAATQRDEAWAKSTEEAVSQHLGQYLDPVQACAALTCHQTPTGWIVVVFIKSPGSVTKWNGKAYNSAGTTIIEMQPAEVMALTLKLPGQTDYSRQPWAGELDAEAVARFCANVASRSGDPTLSDMTAISPGQALDRVKVRGTVTSRILFGDVSYRIAMFDHDGVLLRNNHRSPGYHLLSPAAIREIQDWSKSQLAIQSDPFPDVALKESLANAVAHAAYHVRTGDIIVEVHPDRVEISNLCDPHAGAFANKWFSRQHFTFNPMLMEALRLSRDVDELGRGKNLIMADCLKNGRPAPLVLLERAGLYFRWRLVLYGGSPDPARTRLLHRLHERYKDTRKALIANALVLWHERPVSELTTFVDGDSADAFAQVLNDIDGPVFYDAKSEKLSLARWVRILLGEGKDSKKLSAAEEAHLYNLAYDLKTRYQQGRVTSRELRHYAGMGDTNSETVLMSNLIKKWVAEGKLRKRQKGTYEFVPQEIQIVGHSEIWNEYMKNLVNLSSQATTPGVDTTWSSLIEAEFEVDPPSPE